MTGTGVAGTASTGPAGTSAATGTPASGTTVAGTDSAGIASTVKAATAVAGTATTGAAATGAAATGAATTGAAAIGTSTSAAAATGAATTRASTPGTATTQAATTGAATSGDASTGAAATGAASTGAAAGGTTVWSTHTPGSAADEPAGAQTPSVGLVTSAASGLVVSAPAPGASAAAVAPLPTGTTVPVPLASQVARPLFTLAAAGPGEHTMSISVTPDNLGPVVVRAQISATGIRLEMFAPTDLARDALRLILPDLRRDLAGGALPASLDLSTRSQPGDAGSSGRQDRPAADQQGAQLGGDPRGAQDRRREPGATDQWLRSASAGADTSATDAVTDLARPDRVRGRVDVLA